MLFESAGIGDTIDLVAGPYSASIAPVDVGLSCTGSPEVAIDLDGLAGGRVCLGPEGRASPALVWDVDGLVHSSILLDGVIEYRGAADLRRIELNGAGRTQVAGFFIDNTGCGHGAEVDLFADTLGLAVGAISVSVGVDALVAGADGTMGATDVEVTSTDCSGDVAAAASVLIRAEKGALEAIAGSTLVASGSGLQLSLDESGRAAVRWTMVDEVTSGDARLLLGSQNRSAFGQGGLTVNGDSSPPMVLGFDATGAGEGVLDEITIHFSEAMLSPGSGLSDPEYMMLTDGLGGVAEILFAGFSHDGRTLTIQVTPLVGAAEERWTLWLSDNFRDLAGNRMDGDFDNIAGGDWEGLFGDSEEVGADLIKCWPSTGWFRPDGDEADGSEADHIWLDLLASASSAWWRMDVFDGEDQWVFSHQTPRVRPLDGSLSWDGRDGEGRVLSNGRYVLELRAVDTYGHAGRACSVSVVIDNLVFPG
jgi:hypothetical protein